MCSFKFSSTFFVIPIYPNVFHVCVHVFDENGTTVSQECARLSSCRLTGRCASSLPARLSIENALAGATNASCVKSPLWHLKQSSARVREPAQFGWNGWKIMYCVGHGCGSGWTPEQCGSVADFSIVSETPPVQCQNQNILFDTTRNLSWWIRCIH